MKTTYMTKGTCSRKIDLEIENGIITNCKFTNGCMGNTHGIEKLVVGRDAKEVAKTLKGIDCNGRGTSCPDQLAKAIEQALAE